MAAIIAFARSLAPVFLAAAATSAGAAPLGYYAATPVAAPTHGDLMTHDTPWRVQGASYVAARAPERAEVLCQLVAASVGQLSGFSAAGASFDADKLARCNSKARHASAGATTVAAR